MRDALKKLIIFVVLLIAVVCLFRARTALGATITQYDIENNNGSFTVVYNEDNTIHSLDGDLKGRIVVNEKEALKVINDYRELFQIPENSDFKCVNVQQSLTGTAYMFVQTYNSVEIAGTYVSLVTNNNVLSAITMDINRDIAETAIQLTEDQIEEIIFNKCNKDNYQIHSVKELIVKNRLVYSVYVVNNTNIFALDDMKLFIDAETEEIRTEKQMASMLNTTGLYYNTEETVNIFIHDGIEYLYDATRDIQMVDMRENPSWPIKTIEIDGHVLPENLSITSDELSLAAYNNLITTYDWYEERFDRKSYDDKGGEILCIIGIDALRDNAAYWKNFNVFLIGESKKYDKAPAVFLDTIAHEYTHAVFKSITGECTIRTGETEGINEAYSDIFGCLVDGNWVMAEGIKGDKALSDPSNSGIELVRNRKYPSKYKDDNWSQTDGHINGMLLTRIAYKMSQNGFSNDDIANIWYQSMFYGYSDNSTYLTARHNVEKAARALGYENEQIEIINSFFEEADIK